VSRSTVAQALGIFNQLTPNKGASSASVSSATDSSSSESAYGESADEQMLFDEAKRIVDQEERGQR